MENKSNFPFKTLIWALFAIIVLFVFKPELKQLITNAQEFNVFGIEIKTSEDKFNKLQDSILNFKTKITDLSQEISNNQSKIDALKAIKTKMESDLAKCPEVKQSAVVFNRQLNQIFKSNQELKIKSDRLKNVEILKKNTLINQ